MLKQIKNLTRPASRGDTIVEVLLAIGIAAFAIGITYATAHRSLNQSITAREHTQALNIIENQLTDLKLRFQKSSSPAAFNAAFGSPKDHFCLDDAGIDPKAANWAPYVNDSSTSQSSPLSSSAAPNPANPYYYNAAGKTGCQEQKPGEGAVYYIDIHTTSIPTATQNPTLYQVIVRWTPVGGGQTSQSSLFYRINGGAAQTLGAVTTSPGGGTVCTSQYHDVAVTLDVSHSMLHPFSSDPNPNGTFKLVIEKNAAIQLVNSLGLAPGQNRVGVSQIKAGIPQPTLALTSNASAATSFISALNNNGSEFGTNFNVGLADANKVINASTPPNDKVLIFMSDGLPDLPSGLTTAQYEALILPTTDAMKASGIIIYTVGIDTDSDAGAVDLLTKMSTSGNHYSSVTDQNSFNAVLQSLAGNLSCGPISSAQPLDKLTPHHEYQV